MALLSGSLIYCQIFMTRRVEALTLPTLDLMHEAAVPAEKVAVPAETAAAPAEKVAVPAGTTAHPSGTI